MNWYHHPHPWVPWEGETVCRSVYLYVQVGLAIVYLLWLSTQGTLGKLIISSVCQTVYYDITFLTAVLNPTKFSDSLT